MVVQAVFALQLFSKIKISKRLTNIIKLLAPMSFGVFIIHTTKIVYRYTLYNAFSFVGRYSVFVVIGISIAAVLGIWLICSLIDFIRIYLFKLFGIPKMTKWIERKIEGLLNKI